MKHDTPELRYIEVPDNPEFIRVFKNLCSDEDPWGYSRIYVHNRVLRERMLSVW